MIMQGINIESSVPEKETFTAERLEMELQIFEAFGSVLLICVGYVDLGKWAAAIEGGVHVGLDLLPLLVVFNWIGIFFQYIAARVSLVTNKSLAQICREEYSNFTCVILGVIVLISMMTSQLSMILGVAYGLNLTSEASVASCMFFSMTVVSVFPSLSLFLQTSKLKAACISISGFTLFLYVFGTLISQQQNPLPWHDNPSGLNREAAYAIIALLGANVMPHNMYIQSLLVQRTPHGNISSLISGQFFTMLFTFTGIFLVNYALGSSAVAIVLDNLGLWGPNFQDTSMLMHQIYGNPRALLLYLMLFWSSCLITSSVQNRCWEVIFLQFFTEEFPVPVHRRTVKNFVTIVVLYHIHTLSSEGIYQVLLFCQVLSGILLPSSVVPLLRVSSSTSLMGPFKLSWSLGSLALSAFVTMLIAQIVFLLELVCGHSSWVAELRGDTGGGVTLTFIILLVLTIMSLSFIVYMVFTPFWSSTKTAGTYAFDLDLEKFQLELPELEEADSDIRHVEGEKDDEENDPTATSHIQPIEQAGSNCDEAFSSVPILREKGVSTSDNVGEFAFTRAAKRQFAAILDDFWGMFFDLHGKLTTNAQNLRLDILFGLSSETPRPFPRTLANNSAPSRQSTSTVFATFSAQAGAPFWAHDAESNDSGDVPFHQPENSGTDAYMDQDEGGPPAIFYVEDPSGAGLEFEDVSPAESSVQDSSAGRTSSGLNFPESQFTAPGQSFNRSSPWSLLPYEQHFHPLTMTDNRTDTGMDSEEEFYVVAESEVILLNSFRACIMKLLKVEGAIWLFTQKGGADEELINQTAEAERAKNREEDGVEDAGFENHPPIPFCGDKCIWQSSLIISFGVWCVRRILELLLTENRPELWGKYTYVLNRLQGILAPGFTRVRTVLKPCQCIQLSVAIMPDQQNTAAGSILYLLNQVEAAIGRRKGRAGTPAGDIAFPKGKQNLISALRRYKRKLSSNG